jgi:hypothetical protein
VGAGDYASVGQTHSLDGGILKIVRRLDPSAEVNDLPPKPKGMHWSTYDRLVERYQAYSDIWNLEIMRRFGRHFR